MSKPERTDTSPPSKRRTKSTGYTPNFIKTAFNAMKGGHKREKSKDKESGAAGNNSSQNNEDHAPVATEKKMAQAASTGDVRRSPEKQIRPKSTINGTEQSLDREVLLTEFRKLVEETSTSRTPPVSPATKPRRKLSEAEKKKKRSTLVGPLTKDDLLTPLNFNALPVSAPGSSTNTPLASSGESSSPRQPSPTSADLGKSRRRSISPMEKSARRTTSMQGELSKSGPSIVVNDSQVNGDSEKLQQRLQKQKREQLQKQLDKQSELKREQSSSKVHTPEIDSASAPPRSNSLSEADREQWRQVKVIDVVNLILRIGREQNDLKLPIEQLDLLTCQAMQPTPLQFV